MFDTGSTGFMLIATSLVMLMTPGLAFFYGGLVGRKNVLAIMIQSFVSLGWTTVIWFAFRIFACASVAGQGAVIGDLNMAFLAGTDLNSIYTGNNQIPLYVFCLYQMMFAIITPALITGAFANRIKFPAYMIFLTVWLIFRLLSISAYGLGRWVISTMGSS
jgi:Amt family ammonium transporter